MKYLVRKLSHIKTLLNVSEERAFLRALNCGCTGPIGCSSEYTDNKLTLHGIVLSKDGSHCKKSTVKKVICFSKKQPKNSKKRNIISPHGILIDSLCKDELDKAEKLGVKLAEKLKKGGVMEILDKF